MIFSIAHFFPDSRLQTKLLKSIKHFFTFASLKIKRMQKRVAIITGASSGIGLAIAKELAANGISVVLAARKIESLKELEQEIKLAGGEALSVQTDVSIESDCKNLIQASLTRFGQIDILINNAGLSMRGLFQETDLSVLKTLMDVNFWGTVYCTKYALPHIIQTKGSIVGISSIAGFIGLPGRSGYSASKFAMNGFLSTIRVENLKKGVHVMVVAPGFTASNVRLAALNESGSPQGETPRNEDKMMSAETVAQYVYKGIVKRKRTIILTFTEGKLTVFLSKWVPALLDKLSFNHMAKEPNSPLK